MRGESRASLSETSLSLPGSASQMIGQLVAPDGIGLPEHQLSHRAGVEPMVVNRVFGEGRTHVATVLTPLKDVVTNESLA